LKKEAKTFILIYLEDNMITRGDGMNTAARSVATETSGRVVFILGMHRSGTSMLARLLATQGLPLGESLLDRPARDNRHGYWEQAEIVAVQEALLDGYDRTWHGPNGLQPLPEGWLQAPATVAAKARLTAIVAREIARAGGLWGFKDPRSLRLLPLWREIIAELALDPVFILAARAPGAVAASLMRRNRMSRRFAEALWAAHTIDAMAGAGAELAAVIDYDGWFTAPDAIAAHLRARLALPPRAPDGIARLIDPRLRHHGADAGAVHPAFQALHDALVAHAPHPPPQATLQAAFVAAAAALATVRDTTNTSSRYPRTT
jgi:hypothetical protein